MTISNVTATDGSSGTKTFFFKVSLSAASTQTITVPYATADGTATAAEGDYVSRSGTLTFNPGVTSQYVSVTVNGNTQVEADENFFVNLSPPTNARLLTGQGVGTILNDDLNLSINDVTVSQGTGDASSATFTVTLSAAASFPVTVNFATANGSASAGGDFLATSGMLTFAPGQTAQTITVPILGEPTNEANETFTVTLSNPSNAVLARSKGTATLISGAAQPTISVKDVMMLEGDANTTTFVFTLSLSAASGQNVSVQYATADGTATLAENDYVPASGTLTFQPGQTTKTVSVTVNGDSGYEAAEYFYLNLSNAVNATLGTLKAKGIIVNDDGPF
jgi:hypothetical protein